MEDTLRDPVLFGVNLMGAVLILVLMEDTLRDGLGKSSKEATTGLNPCFNGRYSQSEERTI